MSMEQKTSKNVHILLTHLYFLLAASLSVHCYVVLLRQLEHPLRHLFRSFRLLL